MSSCIPWASHTGTRTESLPRLNRKRSDMLTCTFKDQPYVFGWPLREHRRLPLLQPDFPQSLNPRFFSSSHRSKA
ncbi:rCG38552 [Rattus norvegicus]|uniref:RCG38552 n=1 Tax=Rattus norvegicus TaxID=10116 RepID=A6KMD5_RAT|nr:rCG38552 [Rattus norvegicus]